VKKVGPRGLALKVYQKRKTQIAERRFFPEQIRRREVSLKEGSPSRSGTPMTSERDSDSHPESFLLRP
jgi:hypothetical protein